MSHIIKIFLAFLIAAIGSTPAFADNFKYKHSVKYPRLLAQGFGSPNGVGFPSNGSSSSTSPLTTKGDIWIYNSSDTRLGIGSTSQILQVASGLPAWVTMSGDITISNGVTAIGANKVTRGMEAQGGAKSVVGVTGNSTANVADIQASAGGQVLTTPVAGTSLVFSATPQLGIAGTTAGTLTIAGVTSGTCQIKTAAAAGSGTVFQLPSSNGTNTYVLQTDGSGVTSWVAAAGGGGLTDNATAKTGSWNAVASNAYGVDISAADSTVTLPTAVGVGGQQIFIVIVATKGDASTQLIVNTTSAQNVSQYASGALTSNTLWAVLTFTAHNGNWVLS